MNQFLKFIVTFLLACLAAVILLILFVWGTISYNRYSRTQDAIRYKKEVCDTISQIDERFSLALYGFESTKAKQLNYYLIRQGVIKKQELVLLSKSIKSHAREVSLNIPFLRNDSIAIAIGDRFFLLTGVGYEARYNYGMTGPVGPCFCEATGFETLNGKPVNGFRVVLESDSGLREFPVPGVIVQQPVL